MTKQRIDAAISDLDFLNNEDADDDRRIAWLIKYRHDVQASLRIMRLLVDDGWQDISSAPQTDEDILVLAHNNVLWDEKNQKNIYLEPFIAISSYEDQPYRRGFRHRNGVQGVTKWRPLQSPALEELKKFMEQK